MSAHTTDHAQAAAATLSSAVTTDTIERIRLYRIAIQQLDAQLSADITRARINHETWKTIGDALDISKQAAQQHYGPPTYTREQRAADFKAANPTSLFSDI